MLSYYYVSFVNIKLYNSYTLACHTGVNFCKPVYIGSVTFECDPKQMSSTRADFFGILTWLNCLARIDFMADLLLKVTLHILSVIKAVS